MTQIDADALADIVHGVSLLADIVGARRISVQFDARATPVVHCSAEAIPALEEAGAKWSKWYGDTKAVQRHLMLNLGGVRFSVFETCELRLAKEAL